MMYLPSQKNKKPKINHNDKDTLSNTTQKEKFENTQGKLELCNGEKGTVTDSSQSMKHKKTKTLIKKHDDIQTEIPILKKDNCFKFITNDHSNSDTLKTMTIDFETIQESNNPTKVQSSIPISNGTQPRKFKLSLKSKRKK